MQISYNRRNVAPHRAPVGMLYLYIQHVLMVCVFFMGRLENETLSTQITESTGKMGIWRNGETNLFMRLFYGDCVLSSMGGVFCFRMVEAIFM